MQYSAQESFATKAPRPEGSSPYAFTLSLANGTHKIEGTIIISPERNNNDLKATSSLKRQTKGYESSNLYVPAVIHLSRRSVVGNPRRIFLLLGCSETPLGCSETPRASDRWISEFTSLHLPPPPPNALHKRTYVENRFIGDRS
ncbi:hypothetical protein TNCV_4259501 [Trichonephila clavipes]|nr:hypothetical protein TNCV_4259501 [Trichonephila clavipes]